jgi:hypothetical protein
MMTVDQFINQSLRSGSPTPSAWQPAVDDRVRVRAGDDLICDESPHWAGEEGTVGTVVSTDAAPLAPGHPYFVMFDQTMTFKSRRGMSLSLRGRYYDASELEQLN